MTQTARILTLARARSDATYAAHQARHRELEAAYRAASLAFLAAALSGAPRKRLQLLADEMYLARCAITNNLR